MDRSNRIFFPGNPFPKGHNIQEFSWSGRIVPERGLVFDFHLETAEYDEDEVGDEEEEPEGLSDWESKIVWNNYHQCKLSSTFWGGSGITVTNGSGPFDFSKLQQIVLTADPLPLEEDWDPDDLSFGIYLLGHDSCADHRIAVDRISGNAFNIHWTGKIAQTYAGNYDFDHHFEVNLMAKTFDGIHYPKTWTQEQAREQLSKLVTNPQDYEFQHLNPKSFKREYKLVMKHHEHTT